MLILAEGEKYVGLSELYLSEMSLEAKGWLTAESCRLSCLHLGSHILQLQFLWPASQSLEGGAGIMFFGNLAALTFILTSL